MASHSSDLPLSEARILIVDDDNLTIQHLLRLLESDGYSLCVGLTDPQKAVDQFRTLKPDLVILDWHMEKLGGAEVLAGMKAQSAELTMPPVLVFTGDDCEDVLHDALDAGATDFLTKPVDAFEILLRIRNLLRLHRLHVHAQSETQRLEEKVARRTASLEQKIAELHEMQHQLIQQERLRALGTMAGGIAHDFNNALMVIRGYCDIYANRCETGCKPEDLLKCFKIIGLAAQDASEIVRRLREFYRPYTKGEEDRRPVDINKIVEESIDLARPKWETQTRAKGICINLQTSLQPVPQIAAAGAELREVLINLIFNAVDAMPQGGNLTLRTRVERDQVFVECEDTGTGMTPETRRRCLEPFYTTKGDKGTGLGLAIIYGIVRRHDGTIRLDSEINRGTRITLVLPMIHAEEVTEVAALPATPHLRVLVVDDDPTICDVLARYLEADDHEVTTAANGCEALEKFSPGLFDLVITDRVMPKMNGDQLACAIKELQPDEPIILLTGFDTARRPEAIDLLVSKPATMASLRDAIKLVRPGLALPEIKLSTRWGDEVPSLV